MSKKQAVTERQFLKKSQFLSAFGKSFQIFKAIADAVLAEKGTDEDLGRILVDDDLRKSLATRIMQSRTQPLPETKKIDAAIARLEANREEVEGPKRQRRLEIEEDAQMLLAYLTSPEGKKAVMLLELSRDAIKRHTEVNHRNAWHPNLDVVMGNMSFALELEGCIKTVAWWKEYRSSAGGTFVNFLKHQIGLIADLHLKK